MFFEREGKVGLSREEMLRALKELLEGEGKGKSDAELSGLVSVYDIMKYLFGDVRESGKRQ